MKLTMNAPSNHILTHWDTGWYTSSIRTYKTSQETCHAQVLFVYYYLLLSIYFFIIIIHRRSVQVIRQDGFTANGETEATPQKYGYVIHMSPIRTDDIYPIT